jgi:hypothetical protein
LLARCGLTADGCFIWRGAVQSRGYGSVGVGGGRTALAHRVAWELQRGPIPDGLTIDHLCHNRRCLNVDHMDLVSAPTNSARGAGSSPLYCRAGHPLFGTLGDWDRRPDGKRRCKTCLRALPT